MTEQKLGLYACHYELDGQLYGFDLPGYSMADAQAKLDAIRKTGRVDGRIHHRIKLPAPLMYLALPFLWVWFHVFVFFKGPPPKDDA